MSNKQNVQIQAEAKEVKKVSNEAKAEALKAKAKIRGAAATLAVQTSKLATRAKMRPELKASLHFEAESATFNAAHKASASARAVEKEMQDGLEEAREMMRESSLFAFWFE